MPDTQEEFFAHLAKLAAKWEADAMPLKNKTVNNPACWPLIAEAKARAEIYEKCAKELRDGINNF